MPATEIGPNANCNRDCCECSRQFKDFKLYDKERIDPRFLIYYSNVEAGAKTRGLARSILRDRRHLQEKLSRHGDAVMAKWKKIDQGRRSELISKAQPTMYLRKHPVQRVSFELDDDFPSGGSTLLDNPTQDQVEAALDTQERIKNGVMLPYLSVEGLREDPMKLLSLLHHRAYSAPEEWVMLDVAQTNVAFELGNLCREDNKGCVIMFGDRYGELTTYDREQCHRWNYIGFHRANLILEAQAALLDFLHKITDLIATPTSISTGDARWTAVINAGLKASGEVESWSCFINQPFSAPQVFDASRYLKRARGLLAAAEDHLRFLQTDPTYMHEFVAKQLRGEHMANMSAPKKWSFVVSDLMVHPIKSIRQLRDLVSECKHAAQIYEAHEFQARAGATIPKECDSASGALEFISINLFHHARRHLEQLLRQSPGFHRNFKYLSPTKGKYGSVLHNISEKGGCVTSTYFRDEPLLWALMNLIKNPEDADAIDVSFLFGFVDEIIRSSTKERARIDQTLYDLLARMALYAEVFVGIRSTRPLVTNGSYNALSAETKQRPAWRLWCCTPGNLTVSETTKLTELLKAFYEQPLAKGKRNEGWLDALTVSRGKLSAFWAEAARVRRREVTGIGFSAEDVEKDIHCLRADASDDHLAELKLEREIVAAFTAAEQARKDRVDNAGPMQTMWGAAVEAKAELAKDSTKLKTRPDEDTKAASSTVVVTPQHVQVTEEQEHTCSIVQVKAESFRIFTKMFPSDGQEAKGVEKWQQFVTAMVDAGCSAVHVGGSAVSFEQVAGISNGMKRTIVFHKPHPELNIDAKMLQIVGKRLRKWFGWDKETFVVRGKSVE
ncbi:hypothetical protein LTR37_019721 [Vermiconidia calcicola]|uniref:Uncharacterized protein n=1 Tax=Vermiconidia calcicola TaxID=1690605 RepID=A0ACC3MDH5_9PEZI|nr:hypothetical protein LTR37_019721 [Vermiconidia calcicola]